MSRLQAARDFTIQMKFKASPRHDPGAYPDLGDPLNRD